MRLSLAPRREACQRVRRGRRDRVPATLGPQRNQAVAAAETVALVLDEDSPLPESAADVEELARRLRGHFSQLGVMASPGELRIDLGLVAEEYEHATGRQLGNFPQVYSHIGVIGSALLLQQLGSGATAAKADVLLAVGV